jgi:hypothetical protein
VVAKVNRVVSPVGKDAGHRLKYPSPAYLLAEVAVDLLAKGKWKS